ncbi:hypothetical protein DFH07DRAFT_781821 [Mycena maculata]|uniref:Uncharacterized protein n=1 Tax=Mycena maculata TaxID=230809 RepID=A0AAD7HXZ9_9AGAR|nr:hypothetical protein DFH07DRAFT_781821 [Mycena maculata]
MITAPSTYQTVTDMLLPSGEMRLIYKVLICHFTQSPISPIRCSSHIQVLGSRRVCGRVFCHLNSLGLTYKPVRSDLLLTVRDRDEFWQIDPLIADGFWLTGRLLGNLVVSAAHGINFVDHAVPAVPIQMPIAALRAVGLPIPTILLVLGYPSNPLLDPTGFDTVWDFGTVLGMGKDEFFDLVADSRAEAGLDELDILLSTIEDAPLSYNELDFDVAELICPWYTHLGVVGDSTQVGVGLYPIESDLASPMDTLMSTGFNDMTFEISDMQAKATGKDDIPTLQAWI